MLDLGERVQHTIGHTALGSRLIRAWSGSRSPAYRQLDWFSQDINKARIKNTITVPGVSQAAMLPRNWDLAMVMATTDNELERIHEQVGRGSYSDAVAYISEDVVHVGIGRHGSLFGRLNDEERAIAMRRGRGPLEAMMGLFMHNRELFVGVEVLRLVEETVHIGNLSPKSQVYPEVPLT